jgi:hypothetical protein
VPTCRFAVAACRNGWASHDPARRGDHPGDRSRAWRRRVAARVGASLLVPVIQRSDGLDWHSSGIIICVIGSLKRGLTPSPERSAALARASRLVAKVASTAVQDEFELYLHGFMVSDDGPINVLKAAVRKATPGHLEELAATGGWINTLVGWSDMQADLPSRRLRALAPIRVAGAYLVKKPARRQCASRRVTLVKPVAQFPTGVGQSFRGRARRRSSGTSSDHLRRLCTTSQRFPCPFVRCFGWTPCAGAPETLGNPQPTAPALL